MARGIPKKNDWLPQARTPLCLLLNCTPNDLFDWREDGKTVVHDTHALRTLTKQTNDIQTHLRELPLDKLEEALRANAPRSTPRRCGGPHHGHPHRDGRPDTDCHGVERHDDARGCVASPLSTDEEEESERRHPEREPAEERPAQHGTRMWESEKLAVVPRAAHRGSFTWPGGRAARTACPSRRSRRRPKPSSAAPSASST